MLVFSLGDEGVSLEDKVQGIVGIVFWVALALRCIWYGDELGEGLVGMHYGLVDEPRPGWVVEIMGWILLFLPLILSLWA